jgi:hypothetical protein
LWSPTLQITLLLWVLFIWFYRGVTKGTLEIKKVAFPLPLIAFFILAVFYTFHSIDYAVSRDFLFYLISYLMIFFLVVQISLPQETRWIALAVVILGILTSLKGIYQYLWVFQGLLDNIKTTAVLPPSLSPFTGDIIGRLESGRIFSTFILPSHFAAFLGLSIPVSVAFALTRKGLVRYLFGLALALQGFALYLTKSFGGWLSLFLAFGCFALLYLAYIKRVRARYLISFFAAAVVLLIVIFVGLSMTRPDNPFASIQNNPLVLRVLNWGTTIAMISDSPWIGKGLDTFGLLYPSYQRPGVNIVHHAHNIYLQLGVEMGIIGSVVVIWFAYWWFRRTLAVLRQTKGKGHMVWIGCFMVAGMAFFIHHAFDFEFYMPSVTLTGFAVLALAIGALKKDSVYRVIIHKRRKTLLTFLGFIVVVTASLLLLRPFYGQMHFQRAKNFLDAGPFFTEAAAEFQKAIRLDPANSEYHQHYGALLFQKLARQQEGIAEMQEAIRLSPWRHYYYFDLGMLYLAAGEEGKGLEMIKKASRLYPLNEEYHQWLRSIYLQMGAKALASQEEEWIDRIQKGEGGMKISP